MAKKFLSFEYGGMEEYMSKLRTLENGAPALIKAGIYDGAAIAVEAVKESLRSVVSYEATGSLENSFGLSKMREENGYIYTKIGFEGYDAKGVPQVLKARVLENGTSDKTHKPTRFVSKAMKKAKGAIETQIDITVNDRINKIMK